MKECHGMIIVADRLRHIIMARSHDLVEWGRRRASLPAAGLVQVSRTPAMMAMLGRAPGRRPRSAQVRYRGRSAGRRRGLWRFNNRGVGGSLHSFTFGATRLLFATHLAWLNSRGGYRARRRWPWSMTCAVSRDKHCHCRSKGFGHQRRRFGSATVKRAHEVSSLMLGMRGDR